MVGLSISDNDAPTVGWQAGSSPRGQEPGGASATARFQPHHCAGSRPRCCRVVAWGFLVWAAIDFGRTARGGHGQAWWFLALASVGAVACLFLG